MKVAIVHDVLNEFGGAERVLQTLFKIYPEAELFTAYYDKQVIDDFFPHLEHTRIHSLFSPNSFLTHHISLFQALSPALWKKFDFRCFDLCIVSSAFLNANFARLQAKKNIFYIHSLPKNIFLLESKSPLQSFFPYHWYIRPLYILSLQKASLVLTNSKHIKSCIDRIANISCTVLYPPVTLSRQRKKVQKKKYFLSVGRIDRSKNIEISILACNELKIPLKIVGKTNDNSYENYLRSISGPTIEFLGTKSDQEIAELYKCANGFLFTSYKEDFGIAPLEAISRGVPVIAYYGGGTKETVINEKTGLFFYEHNKDALKKAIIKSNTMKFSSKKMYEHAAQFRESIFIRTLKRHIIKLMTEQE